MKDVSQLVNDLSHPNAAVRLSAAEALAQAGEPVPAAAVPLVRCCGEEDESLREWAIAALEDLGPPSEQDAEALAALLANRAEDSDVAYWAAKLLGRLSEKAASAAPALTELLNSDGPLAARQQAALTLGQIGPAAKVSLDALQAAAASPDARLARLAQQAIERIIRS